MRNKRIKTKKKTSNRLPTYKIQYMSWDRERDETERGQNKEIEDGGMQMSFLKNQIKP